MEKKINEENLHQKKFSIKIHFNDFAFNKFN